MLSATLVSDATPHPAPRSDSTGGRAQPDSVTPRQSVRSHTIMKNPPSAGAAADAHDSLRRHRAYLPRLTERHGADRWLDAPDQRVATLNGEENGMDLYGFLELA